MTEDKNISAFQARLERLNGSKSSQPGFAQQDPLVVEDDFVQAQPKKNKPSVVRQVQVWGVLLLVLVLVGAYLMNIFAGSGAGNADVKIDFAALRGATTGGLRTNNIDGSLASASSTLTEKSSEGLIVRSPLVLGAQGKEAGDILAWFDPEDGSKPPADIVRFSPMSTCVPIRPAAGDKVMGVRLQNGNNQVNIQAFDTAQMVRSQLTGLQVSTNNRRSIRLGVSQKNETDYTLIGQAIATDLKSVDVILTDTTAPIYLVLQTRGGQIIWNLQLAPGVRIAHVVMISETVVGLSGLPTGTSYQAMRISDFVGQNLPAANDTSEKCMIRPWQNPNANWKGWESAQSGNGLGGSWFDVFTEGFVAYDRWYSGTFGVDATSNTVSAFSADHVLLGPVPAEKIDFTPISGNQLILLKTDYVVMGTPAERAAKLSELYEDQMRAVMGGGLDLLWPAPVSGEVN